MQQIYPPIFVFDVRAYPLIRDDSSLYWSRMLKGVIGEPPDDLPWLKKMAMAGLRQLCCGMPPGPMVSFRMDVALGIDVCQSHS